MIPFFSKEPDQPGDSPSRLRGGGGFIHVYLASLKHKLCIFYHEETLFKIFRMTLSLKKIDHKYFLFTFYKMYASINFIRCFLAHLSQRLIGELIGYSWSGVRPSSSSVRRKQFQTSSSPKPLGRSKPNFMWSLLR